VFHKLFVLRC